MCWPAGQNATYGTSRTVFTGIDGLSQPGLSTVDLPCGIPGLQSICACCALFTQPRRPPALPPRLPNGLSCCQPTEPHDGCCPTCKWASSTYLPEQYHPSAAYNHGTTLRLPQIDRGHVLMHACFGPWCEPSTSARCSCPQCSRHSFDCATACMCCLNTGK